MVRGRSLSGPRLRNMQPNTSLRLQSPLGRCFVVLVGLMNRPVLSEAPGRRLPALVCQICPTDHVEKMSPIRLRGYAVGTANRRLPNSFVLEQQFS